MPKVFLQNQKINVIEYGEQAADLSFKDISNAVVSCIKKIVKAA